MAISQRFLQVFSDAYLSDDVDRFMQLVDPDCEWVIMATGETFRGANQVRQLAERSIAARQSLRRPAAVNPVSVASYASKAALRSFGSTIWAYWNERSTVGVVNRASFL